MPKPRTSRIQTTLWLDEADYLILSRLAEEHNLTRAEMIRRAIQYFHLQGARV